MAATKPLRVAWFDAWTNELDHAQQVLPKLACCPPDLYRELAQIDDGAGRRLALVTDADGPVALVLLRRTGRLAWEPVLQWLVPGLPFPVRPGMTVPALMALGLVINAGWWRIAEPLPRSEALHNLESVPTYRLDLAGDHEAHWRAMRLLPEIRRMRRRFERLTSDVDRPGAAEWTIANWSMRWNQTSRAQPGIRDRILIANYLEQAGRHHTICLHDGDQLVAGSANFVDGGDFVAGVYFTDPDYRQRGIDTRLIDQSFSFAAERGFEMFDIGGGHDYKKKWAPPAGSRETFTLAPNGIWRAKQAASVLRDALRPRLRGVSHQQ